MSLDVRTFGMGARTFIPSATVKTNIVLHGSFSRTRHTFTAEQSSETCLMDTWNIIADKRAGHYVVGREGDVYKCIDEEYWTNHVGAGKSFLGINKKTISIYLANELYLNKEGGKYYAFGFNRPHNIYTGDVFEYAHMGYQYWADYNQEQIQSLITLLKAVCLRNDIPLTITSKLTKYAPSELGRVGIVSAGTLDQQAYSLPLPKWIMEQLAAAEFEVL